jgi:hypothetical protein
VFDRAEPGTFMRAVTRLHLALSENTGNVRNISRYPRNFSGIAAQQAKYRFQWTAPIATPPRSEDSYNGANVLFRSHDRGAHWDASAPT